MAKKTTQYRRLRLILGDQLNRQHSWFKQKDDSTLYLFAEMHQELGYVKHHIQKICAFFLAMQAFADELKSKGHKVLYISLDSDLNSDTNPDTAAPKQNIDALLLNCIQTYSIEIFEYQRPDEYRLSEDMNNICNRLDHQGIRSERYETEHFILPFNQLSHHIKKGEHNRMESFYRKLRKSNGILMDGQKPTGGEWNYDQKNRKKLKKADLEVIPEPLIFANDTRVILDRLERHGIPHFGEATEKLVWPVNRKQSLQLLNYFCKILLPRFGDFQDAMTEQSKHAWSLFHSRLSFSMNAKMLHPKEVIDKALATYEKDKKNIDLNQVEGFIRQILGWREYIRATYWVNMPGYTQANELNAQRRLPQYFWTGDTGMACLAQAIKQSLQYAYAHHIQRLMLTGNFCLLFGIHPDEVEAWYLGIYVDAIEWVESPNTRGMSQFADGGLVATKPYAGGGNYINKMSDHCGACQYDIKSKTTDKACPFNAMYWHFMDRHRSRFKTNQRIGMIYRTWDKMNDEIKTATLARAQYCIEHMEEL